MIKVITYGTYDLLHYGHIKLLERAKALGDYLIVGVTADDFDKTRGKINVQQSLMERVEAVRSTGIADEIIIEEYEGQKIDDIKKYDVDIFTVGSDWIGKFDYLNEFCKVVYLPRTEGISSSEIRSEKGEVRLGLVGDVAFLNKVYRESKCVNGINVNGMLSNNAKIMDVYLQEKRVPDYITLLKESDAIYVRSFPEKHYSQIKEALDNGKHVLCESPLTLSDKETTELLDLAQKKNVILMEAIKTAYATAFSRFLLLIKSGKIGEIVSIDATCTSLQREESGWSGFYEWASTALLPIFDILGTDYQDLNIFNHYSEDDENNVDFTKIDFNYKNAVASIKVGDGIKAEGQLIVSGTKGYIYIPAPWWKTDYFEVRYENQNDNKRYFYQLDGEGIRYELVAFLRAISGDVSKISIDSSVSVAISKVMEAYNDKRK